MSRNTERVRSTGPQKLLAVAILVLALLLLTPLAAFAVGVALFAVGVWLVWPFYPRHGQ